MAVQSLSAIRWGAPEQSSPQQLFAICNAETRVTAWSPCPEVGVWAPPASSSGSRNFSSLLVLTEQRSHCAQTIIQFAAFHVTGSRPGSNFQPSGGCGVRAE